MSDAFRMSLKFWGVRGSTPTPGAEYLEFGGNTTSMEIRAVNGERLLIDAGTGIRKLGLKLAEQTEPQQLHLFFTHFHWDHIQGIPFFAPLFKEENRITFHSDASVEEIKVRLQRQMSAPYFTLPFEAVKAQREYVQVDGSFRHGSFHITGFPLHHPQGACGYRIEAGGAVIVIATDLEHGDLNLDRSLREKAEGADILVYDAQYTPTEYQTRTGWGHSTYAAASRVAKDAKVRRLVLFHHDPTHDDGRMTEIGRAASELFETTTVAREMETITL